MEGVVDVFQTVRALRLQRPGMVRSVVSHLSIYYVLSCPLHLSINPLCSTIYPLLYVLIHYIYPSVHYFIY